MSVASSQQPGAKMPTLQEAKLSKEHAQITKVMVKALLSTLQATRELQSIVCEFFLLPTSAAPVTAGKEAFQIYGEAVREAGKGHKLGAPTLHGFGGFVTSLAEQSGDYNTLKEVAVKIYQTEQETLARAIRVFKLKKCYNDEVTRLVLAIDDQEAMKFTASDGVSPGQKPSLRSELRQAIRQIEGCKVLLGQAPAGTLERLLQTVLK